MRGRFTQAHTWEEIMEAFRLLGQPPHNLRPRYNVAPTTMVDVVVDRGRGREIVSMRWGLVPNWAKPDPKKSRQAGVFFCDLQRESRGGRRQADLSRRMAAQPPLHHPGERVP